MNLNRDFWIASALLGFLAGVSNFSIFIYDSLWFYVFNLALIFWLVESWPALTGTGKRKLFLGVFSLGFFLGVMRFGLDIWGNPRLDGLNGAEEGAMEVISLPDIRGQSQEVVLKLLSGEGKTAEMRFLASVGNKCLLPQGFVNDSYVQVGYSVCSSCGIIGAVANCD